MDRPTRGPSRRAGRGRPLTEWLIAETVVGLIILGALLTGSLWLARGHLTGARGGETAPQTAGVSEGGTDTGTAPLADTAIPTPPPTTAQSVFALDVTTDTPLFALDPDQHRAPASLAKMAAGLVVVRAIDQGLINGDDPVTIDAADVVDPAVYSHMGLAAGDTVTVEQLLYGALLPSGDDAGRALARSVGAALPGGDPAAGGDPVAVFVAAMNRDAQSVGATSTHFVNPDGTDDPAQYTTARDLARIGAAVLQSPLLREIVATRSTTVTSVGPEHRRFDLVTTNQLLAEPGIDGLKTGTEDAAGACLAVSAHRANGDRVVVVVLGSAPDTPDPESDPLTRPRYADALAVLQAADVDLQPHRQRPQRPPQEPPADQDEQASIG